MKPINCEQYEFYSMSGNVATAIFPYRNELAVLVVIFPLKNSYTEVVLHKFPSNESFPLY